MTETGEARRDKVRFRSRVRLVDEVAEELRQRIYSGEYPLGAPLRQEQIAEDLEISRTPLREAIRILESEGLLQGERNRTVRVVTVDNAKLLAAYQMREVLDGLAARLAAENPDKKEREKLLDIVRQQEKVLKPWDKTAYRELNVAFHAKLLELANNDYLSAQAPLVNMSGQMFAPITRGSASGFAVRAVKEHRKIANAVIKGDGEEAESMARLHIQTTIEGIRKLED